MFEIIGERPSFNLIAPVEHDLGRNTYRIIGHEMSYHRGLLSMRSTKMGLVHGFTPRDPEIKEPINSLLGFQETLPDENLEEVFEEILRLNEQVRNGIQEIFSGEHKNIPDTNGHYWWHALRLPKTDLMDDNDEFDELKGHTGEKSFIRVYQEPNATLLKIMESSYNKLHKTTKAKIKRALILLG